MKKKRGSSSDGFNPPLAMWGGLLIVAGIVAFQAVAQIMPAPAGSAEARGQAFGRGLGTVLCVIAGVVMIIMHFVRQGRDRR